MEGILEVLLAAACAAGLGLLAWWLFGRLLRPIPRQAMYALLPGRGEGEGLEQSVRAFIWLRSLGMLSCPLAIADIDLTARGREVALRLTLRWPGVVLWPAGELSEYIANP